MQLWKGRFKKELSKTTNDFNSSISFDSRMYKEDIEGSIAHATMLGRCGIIKKELGITVNPKYDIFKGFSERQGAELIDTIKRYVRAEKRRKERTDGKIKT